jgi:hypothetical protein
MLRATLLSFLLLFCAAFAVAADDNATLTVTVLKEYNGKPVRNASVVLHLVDKKGKQKGSQQIKTNAEGVASYPGVPYGKVRVQVIAPDFQTYGEDIEVKQAEVAMTVKLKRPQEQYSIYKK